MAGKEGIETEATGSADLPGIGVVNELRQQERFRGLVSRVSFGKTAPADIKYESKVLVADALPNSHKPYLKMTLVITLEN